MAKDRHNQQQEKSPLGFQMEEEKIGVRTSHMDTSNGRMNERIRKDFANYRMEEQKQGEVILSNSTLPLHFNVSSDPFKEQESSN